MFGDILHLVELLSKAAQNERTADKKREKVAKELLLIYRTVDEVVHRGRRILSLLEEHDVLVHRGLPITLLTQQLEALQRLNDRLQSSAIRDILSLHQPALSKSFVLLTGMKGERVWMTLDQLVSDGEPLSPEEWTSHLKSRMGEPETPYSRSTVDFRWDAQVPAGRFSLGELTRSALMEATKDSELLVVADREEIEKGYALLDQIEGAAEDLRRFLVEKFKFEDVL